MPPPPWTYNPLGTVQAFERKYGATESGALFVWALWSTDSLYYLADLDQTFQLDRSSADPHDDSMVAVAHVRWAATTSITALDLLAAGLARAFCGHSAQRELDLEHSDPRRSTRKGVDIRSLVPIAALHWVDTARGDPDYQRLKAVRDSLVHSRLPRRVSPDDPLMLQLQGHFISAHDLVGLARDTAMKHVSAFLMILGLL